MLIAVVNASSLVTNAQVETMCKAIQIQLNLHALPAWNFTGYTVRFYSDETKVPGYAWIVNIIDNDAQVAGALGYHDEENGKITAYIMCEPILSNGGAVLEFDPNNTSQYTVSATLSHEILEMVGDRFANGFVQGPQTSAGNLYCQEWCDPVEGDSYSVSVDGNNVALSNFIFPSWFNPQATAQFNMPFDYLKKLNAPFTMTSGGYMIVATMNNEGQVTAQHIFGDSCPQWRKNHVRHKMYRR